MNINTIHNIQIISITDQALINIAFFAMDEMKRTNKKFIQTKTNSSKAVNKTHRIMTNRPG